MLGMTYGNRLNRLFPCISIKDSFLTTQKLVNKESSCGTITVVSCPIDFERFCDVSEVAMDGSGLMDDARETKTEAIRRSVSPSDHLINGSKQALKP